MKKDLVGFMLGLGVAKTSIMEGEKNKRNEDIFISLSFFW